MGQIFKKGDKVFDIRYGWGVIVCYNEEVDDWPIEVTFNGAEKMTDSYTSDGRCYINYPPVLSFTAYTLEGFSQDRPEELPSRGDIVWVRDNKIEEWKIMHFIGFHPTSSYKYRVSKVNSYSNTIDYMYMTTINPYANEHN